MNFRITGLDPQPFLHLYGMGESEFEAHGAVRYFGDKKPGFPDRVSLCDAEIGAPVLLVNHVHLDVAGPYRASHASAPALALMCVEHARFERLATPLPDHAELPSDHATLCGRRLGHLDCLYLSEPARGQGWGRQLMACAI
jgi:hypothetical protein